MDATLRGVDDNLPFTPDARTLAQLLIATLDTKYGLSISCGTRAAHRPTESFASTPPRIELDGIAVLVASLDDLARMKRAADRPKDRLDLEEIETIRRLRARRH